MEIGPIAGVRLLTALKPRPVDPELTALFDVESAARAGDDTYTGNGKKAAGAEENEDEELEGSSDDEPASEVGGGPPGGPLSFFA